MSKIQVNAFFRFCRVKITAQRFNMESNLIFIETEPDKRYNPICHNCGSVAMKIHSYNKRMVRDLNIFKAKTSIRSLCDTTGVFDSLFTLVNLEEWILDPRPMQDEYIIVDGECSDLPGFIIGTTPIEFDSLAGPDENPFSTTPLTGAVLLQGESGLIADYFLHGDANGDLVINSADVVYLINYLFKGGSAPKPWEAGDTNCDEVINSADVVYLINYLFKGGPPPCS